MKCTCCSKTDIAGYVQIFGGGVFPLWFCDDHIADGNAIATKMKKEFIAVTKKKFTIDGVNVGGGIGGSRQFEEISLIYMVKLFLNIKI